MEPIAATAFRRLLETRLLLMAVGSLNNLGDQSKKQAAALLTFNIAERRFGLNPGDSRAAYIGATSLIYLDRKPEALEWANIAAEIDSNDLKPVALNRAHLTDFSCLLARQVLRSGLVDHK